MKRNLAAWHWLWISLNLNFFFSSFLLFQTSPRDFLRLFRVSVLTRIPFCLLLRGLCVICFYFCVIFGLGPNGSNFVCLRAVATFSFFRSGWEKIYQVLQSILSAPMMKSRNRRVFVKCRLIANIAWTTRYLLPEGDKDCQQNLTWSEPFWVVIFRPFATDANFHRDGIELDD